MRSTLATVLAIAGVWLSLGPFGRAASSEAQASQQPASASPVSKPVGTVKALSGKVITLTTDAGSTVNILVQDSTRLVRIAPGQKDLKDATPIEMQEVQIGDRILARGQPSEDGTSLAASSVILMKKSDLQAKQERERE